MLLINIIDWEYHISQIEYVTYHTLSISHIMHWFCHIYVPYIKCIPSHVTSYFEWNTYHTLSRAETNARIFANEVRLDVCIFNIFFVMLCNIFNPSKFYVYLTDTKDKTGNHQSHFNALRAPGSQAERLAMKPVLTGQHVLS